ncbi:amidohydrolase family protein [Chloroflexota bacterium]
MKIDIFSHIVPLKYKEAFYNMTAKNFYLKNVIDSLPTLFDLEHRFRIMDKYEGLRHVLSLALPPIEYIADGQKAVDLARLANDEMAELVLKYPDRFVAAAASLPMNDIDAALLEIDRVVKDLNFKAVQIFTPMNDKPLDLPEFMPFYEKVSQYDLPILVHPSRNADYPDYRTESRSRYMIFSNLGWPYETASFMTRLVFSGVLEKYPNLKIITHHCGGMIPFLEQRIVGSYDHAKILRGANYLEELTKPHIDYFKMFYYDTALYGSTPALMCGYDFCGANNLLFGTDMPFDSEFGDRYTRQTIQSIEQMSISEQDKQKIFEDNARRLLHLPV